MLTVIAFIVALGLLIAIHEYGHYRMAVACGVKVLRFSVGFGHTLLRWKFKGSDTEFTLCAFPLGGYVRMLDEREAPVEASQRHLAFNTQSLRSRALIVAAGPMANLLLAVALYALVNWIGVQQAAPVLGSPVVGSLAARAGLTGGERVLSAGFVDAELQPVSSFEDVRWLLTRGALVAKDVQLSVQASGETSVRDITLALVTLQVREADAELFRRIGLVSPYSRAEIGEVMEGGAAERAGLRQGDLVVQMGSQRIVDGAQLRGLIRVAGQGSEAVAAIWKIVREGQALDISVKPDSVQDGGVSIGKISAYVGSVPELVIQRYGPWDGIWQGVIKTWDVSLLTLRMMGKMVIGEASLKNLSGPLTIADYAGRSASMGVTSYLIFLALISVSLGVLNLLPLPVLDGGHLMYYLWEWVTGKSLSDAWQERLQRVGVALLAVMMCIAFFNDINRLLG